MTDTWSSRPFLALDIESTGVDPFTDRVVEIATGLVTPDGDIHDTYRRVVNCGYVIPDIPAKIHGIDTARAVTEGEQPGPVLTDIADRIWHHVATYNGQAAVVAFNARYDITMLLAEGDRHYADIPVAFPIVDPFILDRIVDPNRRGKRKLANVCAHYGVPFNEADAHGALYDATAAGLLAHAIIAKHPELADLSLGGLLIAQMNAYEAWRADFVDWMRRNRDPQFDIPPGWPIPVAPEQGAGAVLVPISSPPADTAPSTTADVVDVQDRGEGVADTTPEPVEPEPAATPEAGEGPPAPTVEIAGLDPDEAIPEMTTTGIPAITKAQRGKLFATAGEIWPKAEQRERVLDCVEALTGARLESRADISCTVGARLIDLLERIQRGESELRRDQSGRIKEWVLDQGWARSEGQAA